MATANSQWGDFAFPFFPGYLDDADLDPYEIRIFLRVLRRAGADGICWESQKSMAIGTRMHLNKVARVLKILQEKRMLRKLPAAKGETCRYKVLPPNLWKCLPVRDAVEGYTSGVEGYTSGVDKGIPISHSLKVSPTRTETLRNDNAEQSSEVGTEAPPRLTLGASDSNGGSEGETGTPDRSLEASARQKIRVWLKAHGVSQVSAFHRNLINARPKAALKAIEELGEWDEDGQSTDNPPAALTDRIHFYAKLGKYAPKKKSDDQNPHQKAKQAVPVAEIEPTEAKSEPLPQPESDSSIATTAPAEPARRFPDVPTEMFSNFSGGSFDLAILNQPSFYVGDGCGYWRLATVDRDEIVFADDSAPMKLRDLDFGDPEYPDCLLAPIEQLAHWKPS